MFSRVFLLVTLTVLTAGTRADVLPTTCGLGSPSQNLTFCDSSLTFEERTADLVGRLTLQQKLDFFTGSPLSPYIEELNIKAFIWDSTCIHGIAPYWVKPEPNVTVFPNTIGIAATWDVVLMRQLSAITAVEARVVTYLAYQQTGGKQISMLSCNGGPLANNAHDPRWGRISETYGEDPYLIAQLGVAAIETMQDRTNGFLKTSQVTRHFLGIHQANDFADPEMNVTARELYDTYLPAYEAFQVEGQCEGIMCSYSSFNGIPSCANREILQDILRNKWKSEAIIQSDCCDSITSIWNLHHYAPDLEGALALAINAGVQLTFNFHPLSIQDVQEAWKKALNTSVLKMEQLDAVVKRYFLTRFKLGEFDDDNPFAKVDPSQLDTKAHRALAKQVASDSVVLLRNQNNLLPLDVNKPRSISVIGPFANCNDTTATNCYLHSYSGIPSSVSTYLDGIRSVVDGHGWTVTYAEGCLATKTISPTAITEAANTAKFSDLVVLVLGLGGAVEIEGLDRVSLTLPQVQQELLDAVRKVKPDGLVLMVVSAGPVALDSSQADAILQVWYAGEQAGIGAAEVLFGAVSPSAKLPLTIYPADYLTKVGPISDYRLDSGVGRTYRYYTETPQYWFGYGLSYATFTYSNLSVTLSPKNGLTATVSVVNNGGLVAKEITQLYIRVPKQTFVTPQISLKGFTKESLTPNQMVALTFEVEPKQLYTVLNDGTSKLMSGTYDVWVGGHQPGDKAGDAAANVLHQQFVIAAQ